MSASKKPTFEEGISRLEEIADQLEEGRLSLEKSLELYEEGARLAAECSAALRSAEQKVTQIKLLSSEVVQ